MKNHAVVFSFARKKKIFFYRRNDFSFTNARPTHLVGRRAFVKNHRVVFSFARKKKIFFYQRNDFLFTNARPTHVVGRRAFLKNYGVVFSAPAEKNLPPITKNHAVVFSAPTEKPPLCNITDRGFFPMQYKNKKSVHLLLSQLTLRHLLPKLHISDLATHEK